MLFGIFLNSNGYLHTVLYFFGHIHSSKQYSKGKRSLQYLIFLDFLQNLIQKNSKRVYYSSNSILFVYTLHNSFANKTIY